jgi:hypothetical protein
VIVKPRRNEEAQAHIGLLSHRGKNTYNNYNKLKNYLSPTQAVKAKWGVEV